MASYHRVLQLFQRSVDDKTLECNWYVLCELFVQSAPAKPSHESDVHAWHVSINGKSWTGKIRLIGYLDVFFLILYTGDSRFEEGIIIYSMCRRRGDDFGMDEELGTEQLRQRKTT
jgi:hypothetical protein